MSKLKASLAGVTYSAGIAHYAQLKNQFLQQYANIANIEQKYAENSFLNQMERELQSESVKDEYSKAFSMFEDVAAAIVENKALVKEKRTEMLSLKNQNIEIGDQELTQLFQEMLGEQELYEIVQQSLAGYAPGFNGIDILNQARSYARKVIQRRIVEGASHNPKTASRSKKVKGYYREALVYSALIKAMGALEANPPVIIESLGAKNTATDIGISFNDINLNATASIPVNNFGDFGVQVKSWELPWINSYKEMSNKAIYFYSIGHRAQLLSQLIARGDHHSWTKGVVMLNELENTKMAIGANNALYVTGSGITFTSDLITKMRAKQYYMAFVFKMDPYEATSNITWQTQQAQRLAFQSYRKT